MVVEVNKIVANLLLSEHAVTIPGVGALRVVRRPAERLPHRRVRPSFYEVEYSPDPQGRSLADAIAQIAGCDEAVAADACARWLARTLQDGVLTIRGVGVLQQQRFGAEPSFDKTLNPYGHEPLKVRRPAGQWMLWTLAAVAVACGVGVCGWIAYDRWAGQWTDATASGGVQALSERTLFRGTEREANASEYTAEAEAATNPSGSGVAGEGNETTEARREGVAGANAAEPGTEAGAVPKNTDATPQTSGTGEQAASLSPARLVSGRTYVVLGVYSTEYNACRAAQQAQAADAALQYGVYIYGSKFMVSPFRADDPAACAAFVRQHAGRMPDAWCYTAR